MHRTLERADRAADGTAMSDWVEAITRAVKVDALKLCSAATMK